MLGALQEMILKHMQPGMKLPAERQLADELKVGRPAVREAIKALEVLDVIERRRGDGNYVKSLAGLGGGWATMVNHIEARFDMLELLEVRKMIEPAAAALAATRRTNRQLREIEIELLAQEARPDDHAVLERHDYLFHEAIIRAARNQVLADTIRFLSPMLQKSRRITGRTTPDIPKIIKQHRTIYEAIRLGEMELAQLAMKDHLQTVGLDLISERKR